MLSSQSALSSRALWHSLRRRLQGEGGGQTQPQQQQHLPAIAADLVVAGNLAAERPIDAELLADEATQQPQAQPPQLQAIDAELVAAGKRLTNRQHAIS